MYQKKLKIGKPLSKNEQKMIYGGLFTIQHCTTEPQIAMCFSDSDCSGNSFCCPHGNCSTSYPF